MPPKSERKYVKLPRRPRALRRRHRPLLPTLQRLPIDELCLASRWATILRCRATRRPARYDLLYLVADQATRYLVKPLARLRARRANSRLRGPPGRRLVAVGCHPCLSSRRARDQLQVRIQTERRWFLQDLRILVQESRPKMSRALRSHELSDAPRDTKKMMPRTR